MSRANLALFFFPFFLLLSFSLIFPNFKKKKKERTKATVQEREREQHNSE